MLNFLNELYTFCATYWAELVVFVVSVIGAASVVVRLTPGKADNIVLDKIIKFLQGVSLYPKDK